MMKSIGKVLVFEARHVNRSEAVRGAVLVVYTSTNFGCSLGLPCIGIIAKMLVQN
jgi:hypothetical protein